MTPDWNSAGLAGKVALVVGGTRGIGAAISRRLASDGAAVTMLYRDRAEVAEALVRDLAGAGRSALAIEADVADPVALVAGMDRALAHHGRLDILVCVAGLAITGDPASYPPDAFDQVFAVNVRAPFVAATRAAASMADGGRIITIGSIVADRAPVAGVALYAASKAALGGMTRGLARDLGPRAITVNLVQPGPIDTERNPADGPNAEANRSPLAIRRHGTADEVAGLVAYLASPEAGFITGSVYNIDGGWSAGCWAGQPPCCSRRRCRSMPTHRLNSEWKRLRKRAIAVTCSVGRTADLLSSPSRDAATNRINRRNRSLLDTC